MYSLEFLLERFRFLAFLVKMAKDTEILVRMGVEEDNISFNLVSFLPLYGNCKYNTSLGNFYLSSYYIYNCEI